MAKKALIEKQRRKPKYAVRAYTRCTRCGRPHAVYRKFGVTSRSAAIARAVALGLIDEAAAVPHDDDLRSAN